MKIVIDIPNHIYEHAKEESEDSNDEWDAMRAIANGSPLPKGHGRLIDADDFFQMFEELDMEPYNDTPTIIEADSGEANEINN